MPRRDTATKPLERTRKRGSAADRRRSARWREARVTLSLNPVAETTQALAALSELVAVPAIFTPGLLPANTTLPALRPTRVTT